MSFDRANTKIVEWADGQGMFKRAEDPAVRVISLGAGVQRGRACLWIRSERP